MPFIIEAPGGSIGAVVDRATAYENQLSTDPEWAMLEGSRHFDEKSAVFSSLKEITRRLEELRIPYAVVGGMALFRYGLRRFTEDVDILVTAESLERIQRELIGLGYVPPYSASRNLRDTSTGVRIEFLVCGDFPGDGRPKEIAFPDPASVSNQLEGISYVRLSTLVELKLASGMTSRGRLKDLADVQELIKSVKLPRDFSEQLHPSVRARFLELWDDSQQA